MLIKRFTLSGDYEKSLRNRRTASLAMLGIGLLGLVCYFFLVPGSHLNDHAQGFYLGAACGLIAAAIVLLIRTQYLLAHPDIQKKTRIKETDEREQHIVNQATRFAGISTFFCGTAALFVVLPFSYQAYLTLVCVLVLYAASFVAASLWLSKKL